MRGYALLTPCLLLPFLLMEPGCGQSGIILTDQPDVGVDRAVPHADQGPRDTDVKVEAANPDATPAADRTPRDLPVTPADTRVVVPDDPQICKPCVVPADCPAVGDRNYVCMNAWYKNSDGVIIEETYCTLICDTHACPTDFDCKPLLDTSGNPVADVCMARPYGVCALLP